MDPAVFGYIRVSQAEGASGLATQRRILTGHGLRDDRIFTDVASGRNMRRPEWQQLRGKLQPGVVVVPRLDRLARNLSEGLRTIEELLAQADAGGPTGQERQRPVGESQALARAGRPGQELECFQGNDCLGGPLVGDAQHPGQVLQGDPGRSRASRKRGRWPASRRVSGWRAAGSRGRAGAAAFR